MTSSAAFFTLASRQNQKKTCQASFDGVEQHVGEVLPQSNLLLHHARNEQSRKFCNLADRMPTCSSVRRF